MNILNFLKNKKHFIFRVLLNFHKDNCFRSAAILTYTSLLSLVPLITVAFALISVLPAFETVERTLHDLILRNFIPSASQLLIEYIDNFHKKATGLTATGVVSLLFTSILTLATIDRSLNAIWHTQKPRKFFNGLLIYWAVLTLGPLLLALSFVLSVQFMQWPLINQNFVGWSLHKLLTAGTPFLFSIFSFTLLYILVPKRTVRFHSALTGGLFAALIFSLAKELFSLYVRYIHTYETLYGAFSAIPLFLIWLFLFWSLVLLGAEITYALDYSDDVEKDYGKRNRFIIDLKILVYLAFAQKKGEKLYFSQLRELEPDLKSIELMDIMLDLEKRELIAKTTKEAWVLQVSTEHIYLDEIFSSGNYQWPDYQEIAAQKSNDLHYDISNLLLSIDHLLKEELHLPLSTFLSEEDKLIQNANNLLSYQKLKLINSDKSKG